MSTPPVVMKRVYQSTVASEKSLAPMKLQPATSPLFSFWAAALNSSQVLAGLQAGRVEQVLAIEIDDRAGVQARDAVDVAALADVPVARSKMPTFFRLAGMKSAKSQSGGVSSDRRCRR